MMMIRTVRTLALLTVSLPLMSGCDTSNNGLITLGAINPDAIVQGLNNPNLTAGNTGTPDDVPVGTDTPNVPDEGPTPLDSPEVTDPEPTGESSVIFSRTGLEAILGYNRLRWILNETDSTWVVEDYFFSNANIVLDSESRPQIVQALPDFSGSIIVLYLVDTDTNTEIYSIARIYSDESVVVHLFVPEDPVSLGVFVYCFPNEAIDICMEDIVDNPDGNMIFESSPNPIAVASGTSSFVRSPDEAVAWMQYARNNSSLVNDRAPRNSSLTMEQIRTAIVRTVVAAH